MLNQAHPTGHSDLDAAPSSRGIGRHRAASRGIARHRAASGGIGRHRAASGGAVTAY
jgi:hypothetical protein